ncbi:pitrilysin family protein [Acuticoccus sp. MNP-M23]|uniref:M16 family metallopeptidase n=1 Tax=Acuticoccus sp. MNP-M23 TaxID=3072793 RepID=UPI002815089E|nr:pitrilysin family protein [Acuticoccus sp. MNP-M23]WMS44847.1 pitrilysin family protein [Acuticoccus sp. MNP-M23]
MFRYLNRAIVVASFVFLGAGSAWAIDIQEVTSTRGITAWLVSDDTVPVVAVDVAFEGAGSAQDPEGKAGRANILASLLDEGAGDLDSVAFQTALQDNAVRLGFESSRDDLYGDMRALTSSVEKGFDLLALALTEPRFDDEALNRMRAQVITGLRRDINDADAVVSDLWARTAFPGHPYGTPSSGTIESVSALTREDFVEAHRNVIAKDNLFVAVVGDIDAETLKGLLDKAFGDLPDHANLTAVADIEPAAGVTVSESLDTPQTSIRFGGVGIERDDDDFIPAFVMNHILGGGTFSSWLFDEVREKRGLAYSVYSYMAPYEHTAIFGAGTATRNDQAEEAIKVILSQFEKMATEGPTEDELAAAKAYLTGSYALRFGSSASIARQLLFLQTEGLGMDYIDNRNDLINAVTLDDVRRSARRVFGDTPPTVAIVGPSEG